MLSRVRPLILFCFCAALAALTLLGIGYSRLLTIEGVCADRECLTAVGFIAPVIPQIPEKAKGIRYYVRPSAGWSEFLFTMPKDEFIEWVQSLGWTAEQIERAHHGGAYGTHCSGVATQHNGIVEFEKGYIMSSEDSARLERRFIAYDETTGTVFCHFVLPLPEKFINERPLVVHAEGVP
jgi:hypothetical protein